MLLCGRGGRILSLSLLLIASAGLLIQKWWITKTAVDRLACPKEINWPEVLNIDYPVNYARRKIIVNPSFNTSRASVTEVDGPLFPKPQLIDPAKDSGWGLEQCAAPLILDIPTFPKEPIDASRIVFGLATFLDRLEDSLPQLERWLGNTKARLLVIAKSSENDLADMIQVADMESRMHGLGIAVTIVGPLEPEDIMPERYFSLVRLLYVHRDKETQWISIVDDDTFFPSMPSLLAALDEHDSNTPQYLGGLSEHWWSVTHYGFMAFGGAGVFLSLPMAAEIDKNYDSCRKRTRAGGGDMRIRECIQWYTNTKLTHVPGLHQMDLAGDLSGFYESGRLPLSLHHWKADWWDDRRPGRWFPMTAMHLVANICGECFLQRWQFGDDTILSNGYSISVYPNHALGNFEKGSGLERMEETWVPPSEVEGSVNHGWDHYIGPTRGKLVLEDEKIQYLFLDAIKVDGGVRQFYIHQSVDGGLDTVIELFWTRMEDSGR